MGQDFYQAKILPYAGIIIKICRAYANTREDFEDYYQEVCLQIWRSRENFKQQCAWSTWIYKVALNVCLTYLKKQQKGPTIETAYSLLPSPDDSNEFEKQESISRLYYAIRQLSEIDRAIILLYLEQQSHQDIAAIIGITANNVAVKVTRIKQRLTHILNSEGSENE